MASIEKRARNGKTRWYVRYRTPDGQQRTKTFDRRVDAEKHLHSVEVTKMVGDFVDPRLSEITVSEWLNTWLETKINLKPSSFAAIERIADKRIRPQWGAMKLSAVRFEDVQTWISSIDRSAATVRKAHHVLSSALAYAVKAGRLPKNPAEGITLPRIIRAERRYLTHKQVEDLAQACGDGWALLVRFLAYTGLRWGEMAALRVRNLDLLRGRARIVESVTEIGGKQVWGTPKNHELREVPIPRFLIPALYEQIEGKAADALVFTGRRDGVLRPGAFQRSALERVADEIGVPGFHPHELRHTAASLAIASGADVKVVQQMLGHKSATMTLDLYGHLFPDRLDTVAEALDQARARALESFSCVPVVYPMRFSGVDK